MESVNGKILKIDLSRRTSKIEDKQESFYRKYIGGRGFALNYMLEEMEAECDPFDPENLLIFASSIIGGAPGPAIPRLTVCSKSPLTDGFGESEAGGFWAPELKKAGFDALVIKGKADKPVYIFIKDGKVEIKDAGHIWGMVTGKAEEKIREEHGDDKIRVAQIGPGGEKMIRYAGIVNDLAHFNGRNGLGAVMGSKNLKAIAVRGSKEINMGDKEKVKEINRWTAKEGMENPLAKSLHEIGTVALVAPHNEMGVLPTRNWNKGTFNGAEKISGEKMKETIGKSPKGCYACPIRCKRVVEVNEDEIKVDPKYGGPEYETVGSLGSTLEIDNIKVVAKANEICNKNTLDTISAGMTIAFAMECYEKGLIDKKETRGIDLSFGNEEAVLEILEQIVKREGLGDLLAEGSYRAAQQWGKEAQGLLKEVKKQEVPMHDPRAKTGVGLQYALADYGADHMKAAHDPFYESEDSYGTETTKKLGIYEPVNPEALGCNKVRLITKLSIFWTLIDMLGACCFGFAPRGPISLDMLEELVQAITGTDISLYEMMEAAERSINMARIFNIRAGFSSENDYLPAVFFESFNDGPREGEGAIDEKEFDNSIRYYYRMLGWSKDSGIPERETLCRLGLEWL